MLSPHQTCKRCSMSSEWQVKYSERRPLQRCFEQTSSPSSTFHSEYCQTAPTCLVTVVTGTRSLVLDSTPLRSKNQKLSVSFLLKASSSSSSVSTRNADMAGRDTMKQSRQIVGTRQLCIERSYVLCYYVSIYIWTISFSLVW